MEKIADRHDSLRQVTALKRQLHSDGRFGRTVGASPQIRAVYTLIEQGTLFLDEIAEMDPSIQAKLLRVLQERTVRRLGGKSELPVDVRVISVRTLHNKLHKFEAEAARRRDTRP